MTPHAGIELACLEEAMLEFLGAARQIVLGFFEHGFSTRTKPDTSPVTEADIAVETALREFIGRRFPEHRVFGEEQGGEDPSNGFSWVVDPIDGTQSFVHGIPTFGIMIGVFYLGEPLTGAIDHPALNLLYHGTRGRGSFCNGERICIPQKGPGTIDSGEVLCVSCYKAFQSGGDERLFEALMNRFPLARIYYDCYGLSRVLAGQAAAMVEFNSPLWDICPCQIIAQEAGGKFDVIKSFTDESGKRLFSIVYGKKGAVEEVSAFIRAFRNSII